jgi:putative FmdB family regulatory protein
VPLYEYECENGHRFEEIQKFSDPPLEKCTTCGAPVHKLMSSPAFQFKGTGWYVTDYAKKDTSPAGATSGESKTSKSEETKSETTKSDTTKSDSPKPAAKSETS